MMTRALDLTLGLVGLCLLLALLPFVALLIKLGSRGPVFVLCDRVGLNGVIFKMYKFRTMYHRAAGLGPSVSPQGDPRVTPVGKALRRLKLNELPQFINVVKGEMTLVGPRPEAPDLAAAYPEAARRIFSVKPGLVGPNQILGRHEEESYPPGVDPVRFYVEQLLPRKIKVDLEYVDSRSLGKDLEYLIKGALAVVAGAVHRRGLKNPGQLPLPETRGAGSRLCRPLSRGLRGFPPLAGPLKRPQKRQKRCAPSYWPEAKGCGWRPLPR